MLRAVALALRARLRDLRTLRGIFLIAQPPLLMEEGSTILGHVKKHYVIEPTAGA